MILALLRSLLLFLPLMAMTAEDVTSSETGSDEARQFGRTYTQWLYDGAVDRLWPRFAPELQSAFADRDRLRAFSDKITGQLGEESKLVEERVLPWIGAAIYNRTARFSRSPDPIWVQWTISPDGKVEGLFVRPALSPAPSRYLDYRTKTRLRLPFDGAWFVFWGGRSVLETYHAVARDQRFAYDFLIVRNGSTHAGDAARNETYFCFGEPILAPGEGTVVAAVDGIADNEPGQMNEDEPLGNHVIIDHGNGEFSFLAHLRKGSVRVRPQQTVSVGDEIGGCGNSGRSSEPHLHYHMQTTPDFGAGEGLPAQFLDYQADSDSIARGEPVRGETVAPQ